MEREKRSLCSSDSTGLNDIANRARMLASYAPDASRNLIREMESLRVCRQDEILSQFADTCRHAVKAYQDSCDKARQLLDELVLLVHRHLPELRLKHVRLVPNWRFDDPKTDWTEIVGELHDIEDAAIRAIVASPSSGTQPAETEDQDNADEEGLDSLLADLTPQQRRMIERLTKSKKDMCRRNDFETYVWRGSIVDPGTVKKAVDRLNDRLYELGSGFVVSLDACFARLHR